MGLLSKIKKTLNPKNVLNPVKAVSTAWDNTKSLVSQDSRNIRGIAKLFGGSATGSGLASKLYREADYNVAHPTAAMRKAAITAATWYAGGLAGAYAGSAAGGAGLSAAQQAAVAAAAKGAVAGGLNSYANGGNPWRGALTGGLTGGLGSYAGPAIASYTGMSPWAANALGAAGTGALGAGLSGGNPWAGALAGGASSLASSGLSGLGAGGFVSQLGGRLAGGLAGGLASGGSSVTGGSGGMSGYTPSQYGGSSVPGSTGQAGSGMSGGVLWRDPVTLAEQGDLNYQNYAYRPVAAEDSREKIADALKDNPEFMAEVKKNPNWLV